MTVEQVTGTAYDTRTRSTTALWSPTVFVGLLLAADLLVLALSAYIAYLIKFETFTVAPRFIGASAVTAFVAITLFHFSNLYKKEMLWRLSWQWRKILFAWFGAALLVVGIGFASKTSAGFSREWSVTWFLLASVLLLANRTLWVSFWKYGMRTGRLKYRTLVVGTLEEVRNVMAGTQRSAMNVVGVLLDQKIFAPGSISDTAVMGSLDEAAEVARSEDVDRILVGAPWDNTEVLERITRSLRSVAVEVDLALPQIAVKIAASNSELGIPSVKLLRRPLSDAEALLKKIEDLVLGWTFLILGAPLMVALALSIKLDSPGPILFRQKRYGFNNELVEIFKFRTMRVDLTDENANQLTRPGDPRVTRTGRILRKLSLDELPQLINVVKGEMSVVGPRPHATLAKADGRLYEDVVSDYASRHRVKPGITGWAQINGWRGDTDTAEKIQKRVEHDLYYIDNWSLWLDIRIIVKTLLGGFAGRNAY